MNNWTKRIKLRMNELGLTQEMVASKMGITRGAITHYLSGRRVPPLKQFHKLALILKVDPAWLQYGTTDTSESTKNGEKRQKSEQGHRIPLLAWDQVGFTNKSTPSNNKQEFVPHLFVDNENWLALKVKGDSMTSTLSHHKNFYDNDIIIVDSEKKAENGDFVVALLPLAKEATFKQYVIDGGVKYLKPLNPQYPIVEVDKGTNIFGVVIGRFSSF